jgi:hypothetical protein
VAEDALTTSCAPSYELRAGIEAEEPLILAALEQGWAVSVPDYEGPGSEWAVGAQAGHAVLDGIRAAENFAALGLSTATPVGLWGYSGGGQASAFAAELQPSYAPGINLVGVAEGGVPVNLADVANKVDGTEGSGIYFGAAVSLARAYPTLIDTATLLNAAGQQMDATVSNECIDSFAAQYAFQRLESYTTGGINPLTLPGVAQVVAYNELGQHVPTAPVYLYVSANDELLPIADDTALAALYCKAGLPVDEVIDQASEHISLAALGAGSAIDYLAGRFAGQASPSTCATGPASTLSTLASTQALVTELTSITGLVGFL